MKPHPKPVSSALCQRNSSGTIRGQEARGASVPSDDFRSICGTPEVGNERFTKVQKPDLKACLLMSFFRLDALLSNKGTKFSTMSFGAMFNLVFASLCLTMLQVVLAFHGSRQGGGNTALYGMVVSISIVKLVASGVVRSSTPRTPVPTKVDDMRLHTMNIPLRQLISNHVWRTFVKAKESLGRAWCVCHHDVTTHTPGWE